MTLAAGSRFASIGEFHMDLGRGDRSEIWTLDGSRSSRWWGGGKRRLKRYGGNLAVLCDLVGGQNRLKMLLTKFLTETDGPNHGNVTSFIIRYR
jgi:hypothetical protein